MPKQDVVETNRIGFVHSRHYTDTEATMEVVGN